MKNILVGNGINIQYDNENYTCKNIVLRVLTELDEEDYPCEYIVDNPMLIKSYMGKLFLAAREALDGGLDKYPNCTAERKGLNDFKDRYKSKKKSLRIADIGFEDYYLIHDLLCHKTHTQNPEQYTIRESLKMAYFHSIYNRGKLNLLHKEYSLGLVDYLKSFDNIFTTNYDSNLESATGKKIYHIHGQFDKLSETYNPTSFRNHLNDNPLEGIPNQPEYKHLHSTALSTYCGDYKRYQIKQNILANEALEKMANGYQTMTSIKKDVDTWETEKNQLVVNLGQAIKLKVANPNLRFQEDYYVKEFQAITGELTILGLSPYNDYHIFEMIESAKLLKCKFYYYNESECERIKTLLPNLYRERKLEFLNVQIFWEGL
ncbi:hypothetical protein RZ882_015565 [Clostridioides difficile]|uniref:hypothetical protein n=1 Tax=Clostridioides difficile TaxID=1496 RepID=UPI0008A4844B|nr:hypothetical protein [Clostridioides difficile]OFU31593.1 hypothetical protein HMPREF3075_08840 [Clostridium sp. HMSC19B11]EGT3844969.1 hypothetical protein [Clostridioides difficile]EGT4697125.1 hypothetical protein [Clostridioides difficile]EGT4916154.1 hypothetical protein [Clostridioides difficile]MBF9870349.1 hypothetical protein [Clostridioides difficile]